ncbi:Protein SRG-24, partial [Aphelenchoides avenae]
NSLFQRLVRNKLAPKFFVDTPVLVTFSLFSSGYLSYFEYLTHTTIAFDRYVNIVHPASSVQAWMERLASLILSLQFLMPLALAWVRLAMNPSVFEVEDGYAIRVENNWASRISGMISICVAIGTCVISLALEMRTLVAYRAIASQRRYQLRDDYKLLVYALCGLVSQLLIAAYYIVVYAFAPTNPNVYATTQFLVAYIYDILTLSGPVCLFVTSEALRKAYFSVYTLPCRCKWANAQSTTSAVRSIS